MVRRNLEATLPTRTVGGRPSELVALARKVVLTAIDRNRNKVAIADERNGLTTHRMTYISHYASVPT